MTMVVVANRAAEQTDPATRQLVRVSPRQVPDDVLDEGIAAELTSIPGTGLGNDRLAGQLVDEHCRGPVAGPRHGPRKPRLYAQRPRSERASYQAGGARHTRLPV